MKTSPASARMLAAARGYGLQLAMTFAAAFVAPAPVEAAPAPITETVEHTAMIELQNAAQTQSHQVAPATVAAFLAGIIGVNADHAALNAWVAANVAYIKANVTAFDARPGVELQLCKTVKEQNAALDMICDVCGID